MPNRALIPYNLLGLVRFFTHDLDADISFQLLLWNFLKHGVFFKMTAVPVVKVLHIGHLVNSASWLQDVGVIGQQLLVNNSASVINFLKMWVCKTDKHFFNLSKVKP